MLFLSKTPCLASTCLTRIGSQTNNNVYRASDETLTSVYSLFIYLLWPIISPSLTLTCLVPSTMGEFHTLTASCLVQHSTQWTRCVYLDSALMDLCLMSRLCYLADVSRLSPRFPCNTFGPGGFILQTAAATRDSGYQLADQHFSPHYSQQRENFFLHRLQNILKYSCYDHTSCILF